jgi:hypothetical protein
MRLSRTERFSPVDLLDFFAVAEDVDAAIRILQKVPDAAEVGVSLPESPA